MAFVNITYSARSAVAALPIDLTDISQVVLLLAPGAIAAAIHLFLENRAKKRLEQLKAMKG
jgi:hypothetical protein